MTDKPAPEIPVLPRFHNKTAGKRVPWDRDPNILRRLEVTAQMLLAGATLVQVAEATDCSVDTVKRDRKRVEELWRRESVDKVETLRGKSIAQYRRIQTQAWAEWQKTHKGMYLRIISDTEEKISDLQGTKAPIQVDWRVEAEQHGIDTESLYAQIEDMMRGKIIDGEVIGRDIDQDDGATTPEHDWPAIGPGD